MTVLEMSGDGATSDGDMVQGTSFKTGVEASMAITVSEKFTIPLAPSTHSIC